VPEARLVAVLRDPVERAHSSYLQHLRDGLEPLPDFQSALEQEETRRAAGWAPSYGYLRRGLYGAQLRRWLEEFPSDQLKVFLYEDLERDSATVCRDVFHHLGVEADFIPDTSIRHNRSGIPRSRALATAVARSHRARMALRGLIPERPRRRLWAAMEQRNLERPALSAQERRPLVEFFGEDILDLQALIDRDLSRWLAPA